VTTAVDHPKIKDDTIDEMIDTSTIGPRVIRFGARFTF
jgi:hypothetical protein